jgi:hypothetical protein
MPATLPFTGWDAGPWATAIALCLAAGGGLVIGQRDRVRKTEVLVTVERPDGTVGSFSLTADEVHQRD